MCDGPIYLKMACSSQAIFYLTNIFYYTSIFSNAWRVASALKRFSLGQLSGQTGIMLTADPIVVPILVVPCTTDTRHWRLITQETGNKTITLSVDRHVWGYQNAKLLDKTRRYQYRKTIVSLCLLLRRPLSQRLSSYRLQLLPMERAIRSLINE